MNIQTREDWWDLVDRQWDNLLAMAGDQLDLTCPAHVVPGNPNTALTGNTILQEMIYLKRQRHPDLSRYFNAIWGLASDRYAYPKPGWGDLCDLCSEEYVLKEEVNETVG